MSIQHRYQFEALHTDIVTIKIAQMFAPYNENADPDIRFQSDFLFYFISQVCVKSVFLTNIKCILNEYFIDKRIKRKL